MCVRSNPTVLRISWGCPQYESLRRPLLQKITPDQLPMSTRYSTLIPESSTMTIPQIQLFQSTLVTNWQQYIRDFKSGQRSQQQQHQRSSGSETLDQNGHTICPRPNNKPGVFCCKCGKFVARSKHIKLKITAIPCTQKDSQTILTEEGYSRSQNRLDTAYEKLQQKYGTGVSVKLWEGQMRDSFLAPRVMVYGSGQTDVTL